MMRSNGVNVLMNKAACTGIFIEYQLLFMQGVCATGCCKGCVPSWVSSAHVTAADVDAPEHGLCGCVHTVIMCIM